LNHLFLVSAAAKFRTTEFEDWKVIKDPFVSYDR